MENSEKKKAIKTKRRKQKNRKGKGRRENELNRNKIWIADCAHLSLVEFVR